MDTGEKTGAASLNVQSAIINIFVTSKNNRCNNFLAVYAEIIEFKDIYAYIHLCYIFIHT